MGNFINSDELYLSAGEHSLVCDNFYLTNFILLLFIYLLLNFGNKAY